MKNESTPLCPHCGRKMKKWRVPEGSTWPDTFFYVCFNDQCPYFTRGWQHIRERMGTQASYRCRFDPYANKYMPLPVWSSEALKENIIE